MCVHCFITREAANINLNPPIYLCSRKWWRFRRTEFEQLLSARVAAIKAGLEPGPADELVDVFYHGYYTPHRGAKARGTVKAMLFKLIATADRRAKGNLDGEHTDDGGGPQDG
jgi:hypothetical protein